LRPLQQGHQGLAWVGARHCLLFFLTGRFNYANL
jgi:hypothetical protein